MQILIPVAQTAFNWFGNSPFSDKVLTLTLDLLTAETSNTCTGKGAVLTTLITTLKPEKDSQTFAV